MESPIGFFQPFQLVIYIISLNNQVSIGITITNESSEVLLDKTYSERYYSGGLIGVVKAELQAAIVADWDELVAEENIFDAAAFGTMVTEIQTAANTYINA